MNIALQGKSLPFALDNRMTVVLFAGMGGGCDGLEEAGFHVHLAINHDPVAIAVHQVRHRHTRHLKTDVLDVCPKEATKGRGVRALHASPDCTHFSVAKGGKPVSKRRRSLAWVVCRWAGQVRPETITLENVSEIQTWGPLIAKRDKATGRVLRLDGSVAAKGERVPVQEQWLVPDPKHRGRIWKAWLRHLRVHLGYNFEYRVLVCADYGVATIRKRLFGVGKADGSPIVWPERTHAPRKLAKKLGLKPWVGANTIIDFSLPVKSIFGRKKELAEATKRRTARGVMRYVVEAAKPFIVPITHTKGSNQARSTDEPLCAITTAKGGENMVAVPSIAKFRTGSVGNDMREPLATFTANSFDTRPGGAIPLGLMAATMVQTGYGEREGQAPRTLDLMQPLGTQVGGGSKAALVSAFLAQHNSDPRADGTKAARKGRGADEPLAALTTSPQVAVSSVFLAQHSAGSHPGQPARDPLDPVSTITSAGSQQGVVAASMLALRGTSKHGRDILEPLAATCASGNHAGLILGFLQHYYGTGGQDQSLDVPLGALTSKARHGLVTVKIGRDTYVITDIGVRMLEPEEGAAAHGFKPGALPDHITIDGKMQKLTKTQKYHLVGNSVPPKMIRLLAELNVRHELVMEAAE
jgi:DNA (cytosine-5)-methyltransferase 1